ncbi:LysE family translocator [Insolitispirillum peregrinum]|uniref:Threonine/homoserine/homoserine lactone efflux protein n=1 Tax=Insolitispirillum peregrinum TaxID=80876 RepID=A0A1N7JGA8_9PROT|nr:LysE family translocator [Insolitispirillum peregrinum]SIS48276.1 Threonine/homoserine/homoserine lactone efflux protein [Insolitispirillum peregrinum]
MLSLATLIDFDLYRLYLLAVLILILIPGPDMLLILSRGLFEGWKAGWIATAGIGVGALVHSVLAALGVSALIAASPHLFGVLQIVGAFYLLWVGSKSLQGAWKLWKAQAGGAVPQVARLSPRKTFLHGMMTNLLNVKIILFFLAFVPQFVNPALGHVGVQSLILGLTLALFGCGFLLVMAVMASGVGKALMGSTRIRAALDGIAGVIFIGFAIRLFLTERKFA